MSKAKETKVGYIAVYRTGDFQGRNLLDANDNIIYESRTECELDCENDDNFVAVATVTWKE